MSETADRYRRLSQAFADKLAVVSDDGWVAPTPCSEWDVRALVEHVVSSQGMFLGFVDKDLGDIPSIDDDPAGVWDAARARLQAELDDPEAAAAGFEGFFGPTTLEASVDRFINFDLVIHGWDLARATGLDTRIAPEDVIRCAAAIEGFGDTLRTSGAAGPALDAPADADEQTRLLAELGRQAW